MASFGVLATHVSFQTGMDPATPVGSVLARFDYFVAVFFALSAFLLWRGQLGGRRIRTGGDVARYLRNRLGRILPAYLACVAAVVLLLPDAAGMDLGQILANLTMTQIYVADGLAPGLTHLWSLCVEMAFYVALPVLVLLAPARCTGRIVLTVLVAALSLGWAFLPFVEATPAEGVANRQIWPPAYACWFAVGILAAECEGRVGPRVRRVLRARWLWWALALVTAWMAGQEFFGPLGLTHPSPGEFVLRILAGTVFAAALVVPYALAPADGWLASPPMTWLGRISYSVFLWHLAVMAVVFPLSGIDYFQGGQDFLPVFALTAVITVVVSAASYVFIEEPARRFVRALGARGSSTSTTRHDIASAQTAASASSSPA